MPTRIRPSDLDGRTPLALVGDSTWCDARLLRILGTIRPYAIDSLVAQLVPTQGLCVVTPANEGRGLLCDHCAGHERR